MAKKFDKKGPKSWSYTIAQMRAFLLALVKQCGPKPTWADFNRFRKEFGGPSSGAIYAHYSDLQSAIQQAMLPPQPGDDEVFTGGRYTAGSNRLSQGVQPDGSIFVNWLDPDPLALEARIDSFAAKRSAAE